MFTVLAARRKEAPVHEYLKKRHPKGVKADLGVAFGHAARSHESVEGHSSEVYTLCRKCIIIAIGESMKKERQAVIAKNPPPADRER